MTKLQAVNEIRDQDDTRSRRSKASLKRLRKAAEVLGLSATEVITLECSMEYRDFNGKLYP